MKFLTLVKAIYKEKKKQKQRKQCEEILDEESRQRNEKAKKSSFIRPEGLSPEEKDIKIKELQKYIADYKIASIENANTILDQCYKEIKELDEQIERKKAELKSISVEKAIAERVSAVEEKYKKEIHDLKLKVEQQELLLSQNSMKK